MKSSEEELTDDIAQLDKDEIQVQFVVQLVQSRLTDLYGVPFSELSLPTLKVLKTAFDISLKHAIEMLYYWKDSELNVNEALKEIQKSDKFVNS